MRRRRREERQNGGEQEEERKRKMLWGGGGGGPAPLLPFPPPDQRRDVPSKSTRQGGGRSHRPLSPIHLPFPRPRDTLPAPTVAAASYLPRPCRFAEADESLSLGVRIHEQLLGPRHPQLVRPLINKAENAAMWGDSIGMSGKEHVQMAKDLLDRASLILTATPPTSRELMGEEELRLQDVSARHSCLPRIPVPHAGLVQTLLPPTFKPYLRSLPSSAAANPIPSPWPLPSAVVLLLPSRYALLSLRPFLPLWPPRCLVPRCCSASQQVLLPSSSPRPPPPCASPSRLPSPAVVMTTSLCPGCFPATSSEPSHNAAPLPLMPFLFCLSLPGRLSPLCWIRSPPSLPPLPLPQPSTSASSPVSCSQQPPLPVSPPLPSLSPQLPHVSLSPCSISPPFLTAFLCCSGQMKEVVRQMLAAMSPPEELMTTAKGPLRLPPLPPGVENLTEGGIVFGSLNRSLFSSSLIFHPPSFPSSVPLPPPHPTARSSRSLLKCFPQCVPQSHSAASAAAGLAALPDRSPARPCLNIRTVHLLPSSLQDVKLGLLRLSCLRRLGACPHAGGTEPTGALPLALLLSSTPPCVARDVSAPPRPAPAQSSVKTCQRSRLSSPQSIFRMRCAVPFEQLAQRCPHPPLALPFVLRPPCCLSLCLFPAPCLTLRHLPLGVLLSQIRRSCMASCPHHLMHVSALS